MKKNKKKHAGGRPTKYRPEMAQAMIRFFDIEPYVAKDMTITTKDGTQIDKTVIEPSDVPFYVDFCSSIGITQETMNQWTKIHPEFSEAYKKTKQLQEKVIVVNAMRGLYNSTFSIFTLKNIAGWRDTQHIDAKGVASQYHFTTIAVKDLNIKSPEDLIGCFRETVSKKT